MSKDINDFAGFGFIQNLIIVSCQDAQADVSCCPKTCPNLNIVNVSYCIFIKSAVKFVPKLKTDRRLLISGSDD